ncbi:MAG: ribonuclease III [Alphaproteobacteria bacterium]
MADNPRADAVRALEAALGHRFADPALLERALTHPSVGDGARMVRHYERLEFLGDRVLGLLAAERLLALDPDAKEGEMSPMLASVVNGKACARVARKLGVGPALKLSPAETKSGGRDKDTILGDACEALMAALYIDGGLDTARAFFLEFWADEFAGLKATQAKDSKTQLQEWAQSQGLALPVYQVIGRTGPDHAPSFTVQVSVEGFGAEAAEGRSRQDAEKAAALVMLIKREGAQ